MFGWLYRTFLGGSTSDDHEVVNTTKTDTIGNETKEGEAGTTSIINQPNSDISTIAQGSIDVTDLDVVSEIVSTPLRDDTPTSSENTVTLQTGVPDSVLNAQEQSEQHQLDISIESKSHTIIQPTQSHCITSDDANNNCSIVSSTDSATPIPTDDDVVVVPTIVSAGSTPIKKTKSSSATDGDDKDSIDDNNDEEEDMVEINRKRATTATAAVSLVVDLEYVAIRTNKNKKIRTC